MHLAFDQLSLQDSPPSLLPSHGEGKFTLFSFWFLSLVE